MKAKWVIAVLFILPTIGAGYLAWLLWRENQDGRWLFTVVTFFLFVMSFAPFLPARWWQGLCAGYRGTRPWTL
jgi:hypothetical protein